MLALNTWSFPGYSGISQRIVSMLLHGDYVTGFNQIFLGDK